MGKVGGYVAAVVVILIASTSSVESFPTIPIVWSSLAGFVVIFRDLVNNVKDNIERLRDVADNI